MTSSPLFLFFFFQFALPFLSLFTLPWQHSPVIADTAYDEAAAFIEGVGCYSDCLGDKDFDSFGKRWWFLQLWMVNSIEGVWRGVWPLIYEPVTATESFMVLVSRGDVEWIDFVIDFGVTAKSTGNRQVFCEASLSRESVSPLFIYIFTISRKYLKDKIIQFQA